MTVCRYWQQGNCRNGNNCRFEHPNANQNQSPFGGGNANGNRFGALAGGGGGNNLNTGRPNAKDNPWRITEEGIRVDLTDDKPQWILSAYGPGRDAPEQLFGGYPREQSVEELRLYVLSSSNQQQAMQEVTNLYQTATQQIQTTLSNIPAAIDFITNAANNHPNRIDICKQSTREGGTSGTFAQGANGSTSNALGSQNANQNPFQSTSQPNPFGSTSNTAAGGGSAFGQPSSLGQKPNPFGSPAFGQPAQLGASGPAFGQASQMGAGGPAFGQAAQLGQKPNPFGAPAGQSGFGQPAQPASGFGQPSQLGQKPNPFGSPASTSSGFAQLGQQGASAFGQPSQLGQAPNPFGQPGQAPGQSQPANPFAAGGTPNQGMDSAMEISAPQKSANNPSPFGQPAGLGQKPAESASPFGQPSALGQRPNPFAAAAPAPAANTPSPFGQPAPSSAAPANPFSAFGQPNGFSQPAANPAAAQQGAAADPSASPYAPESTKQHPPITSYAQRGMNGQLAMFKNRPVTYKDGKPGYTNMAGVWTRIWFPDGAPRYYKATEGDDSQYTEGIRKAFERMNQMGRFDGAMPVCPPRREDCLWDF